MLITENGFRELEQWLHTFRASEVVRQIHIFEKLIDDDDFAESLLIDEALQIYMLLLYECVYRMPFVPDSWPSMG